MRIVALVPRHDFTIETSWPVERAVGEIQKRVGTEPTLRGGRQTFVGEAVGPREFKFHRRTFARSSTTPIVVAMVEPGRRDGARIVVRMRPHFLVRVFLPLWIVVVTLGSLAIVWNADRQPQWLGLWAIPFPAFAIGVFHVPFRLSARKSERVLRDVFVQAPALPNPETDKPYR